MTSVTRSTPSSQSLRVKSPCSTARDRRSRVTSRQAFSGFLNRIECHSWGIGEFVVKNAEHPDWSTLAKAMADHIRYRNGPHRDQRLIKAERRPLIAA